MIALIAKTFGVSPKIARRLEFRIRLRQYESIKRAVAKEAERPINNGD